MPTISGNQTAAITLGIALPSVTLDAVINASGADGLYLLPNSNPQLATTLYSAVYGPKTGDFTVVNDLDVVSSLDSGIGADAGILLGTTGTVINLGEIIAQNGVIILGAGVDGSETNGRVENENVINASSSGIYLIGFGSVTNSGTVLSAGNDIILNRGGYVFNKGTMAGQSGIYASSTPSSGIYNANGSYIFNAGTIIATGAFGWGAYAAGPQAVISNTGIINTEWQGVVLTSYGATYNFGAVYNFGTIRGGYFGVEASQGGYVLNTGIIDTHLGASNGQSAPAGRKAGTIALPVGFGIAVGQGGTAVNSGSVCGMAAIYLQYGGGTIVNTGSIQGSGDGVFMRSIGTLSNQGTIYAKTGVFSPGGVISNGGAISGYGNGYGIILDGGGTISNSGTISGGYTGVLSYGGTVISSGVIRGANLAVRFRQDVQQENAGRLIIEPDAVFEGGLAGEGAALELGAGGTNPNILTFGSTGAYGFAGVTIDSGGVWTLAGNATIVSVANYGTIVLAAGSDITIDYESGGGQINTEQANTVIITNAALSLDASLAFLTPTSLPRLTPDPALTDGASYDNLHKNPRIPFMPVSSTAGSIEFSTSISHSALVMTLQA